MKTNSVVKVMLVVAAVLMLVAAPAASQVVRVDDWIVQKEQYSTSSAGDSVYDISLAYTGNVHRNIQGALPESVKIGYYATGDSIYALFLRFKGKHQNAPLSGYTSALIDSIKSTTATAKTGSFLVAATNWNYFDKVGVSVQPRTYGNPFTATNGSKIYVRLERYFKLP